MWTERLRPRNGHYRSRQPESSPQRLSWSTRPNAPERAITWLKASASAHVTHMRELASLLEHKDVPVAIPFLGEIT
jgi:hypothetical protein